MTPQLKIRLHLQQADHRWRKEVEHQLHCDLLLSLCALLVRELLPPQKLPRRSGQNILRIQQPSDQSLQTRLHDRRYGPKCHLQEPAPAPRIRKADHSVADARRNFVDPPHVARRPLGGVEVVPARAGGNRVPPHNPSDDGNNAALQQQGLVGLDHV